MLVGAFTLAFLCFNVYGLTLYWSPQRRQVRRQQRDCQLSSLLLAIIVMFLALPCACFALQLWFERQQGSSRK